MSVNVKFVVKNITPIITMNMVTKNTMLNNIGHNDLTIS